jgi:formylglycine-generating enzyme required for sulfatase activity
MAKKKTSKDTASAGSEVRPLESDDPALIRAQVVDMLKGGSEDAARTRNEVRKALLLAFTGPDLPLAARIEIAGILDKLGDPRFDARLCQLPRDGKCGFLLVEAGEFWMGSDPNLDSQAYEDEEPLHKVFLPDYYIARWPVTVGQFRAFVEDSGHRMQNDDSLNRGSNQPVGWVYWADAVAYCDWLNGRLPALEGTPAELRERLLSGWRVTLPSEAEWEKAARGTTGRIYAWGNEYGAELANTAEGELGIPSPVGCFPGGRGPFGLEDASGNVWEWTRSKWLEWGAYPYPDSLEERAEREANGGGAARVLRGGSFSDAAWNARCARRIGRNLYDRYGNFGFRVAISPQGG